MARVNFTLPEMARITAAWRLDPASIRPTGSGLINNTFLARTRHGEWCVLQQVNPLFGPAVNDDIEAVTAHLAARGVPTPRLVRTIEGDLCLPDPAGAWRVLTRVEGRVLEAVTHPVQAREAGRLLASFHRALDDFDHPFRHVRPPVHEPARHLAGLERAVETHVTHRLHSAAAALADEIFAAAAALSVLPRTAPRVVHGDPKISNLVYAAESDRALCMIDLDTTGRMPLPYELGDAFRSWCSVSTEDDPAGQFSAALFAAAAEGYGAVANAWISLEEAAAAVDATATIQVELAARFCADVLNENYFGWNPARFPARADHNLVRARGQLAAHRSLLKQRASLEAIARAAFRQA
jgi:Ser/Thr protein kinase RdoA (MazF antagonist)